MLVLAVTASFYRFYFLQDYQVKNEIECDPYTESCYVWCEDADCIEPYYYAYTTRSAQELKSLCSTEDINDCDEAWYCDPTEIACEVEYCDPESGDCEDLTVLDIHQEDITDSAI